MSLVHMVDVKHVTLSYDNRVEENIILVDANNFYKGHKAKHLFLKESLCQGF